MRPYFIFLVFVLFLLGCGNEGGSNSAPGNEPGNFARKLSWESGPKSGKGNQFWLRFWDKKESSERGPYRSPGEVKVSVRMSCCQTPATFKVEETRDGEFRVHGLELWDGEFDIKAAVKRDGKWIQVFETKVRAD